MPSDRPWNDDVKGAATLNLINSDATTIRVEAGPGTGKTLALVRRVERILHPNGLSVPGKHVLVVAFNRVIAAKLREDIAQRLVYLPIEDHPVIRTVHALCLEVIGEPLRILLPHEREAMIYDVLTGFPAIASRYNYAAANQALFDHEAGITEDTALWQAVTQWLVRHRAVLISDLPPRLLAKIHGGDFEGRKYAHVIVDEFQDLTQGEQLLFMKLRRDGGSLTALGDSKQSIYRFRGNDRLGLRKLETLDPGVQVTELPLADCYRCPAPMVEAANRLMTLYPPPMNAVNTDPALIHVIHWKNPAAEAEGLAPHVIANIRANPRDRHLAMVTRKAFGYALRNEMKRLAPDLTIDLSFSESLLEEWPVREAFLYFSLLADADPPTWRAWLGYKLPESDGKMIAPRRNSDAYLKLLDRSADNITRDVIYGVAASPASQVQGGGGKNVWNRASRFVELNRQFGFDSLPNDPDAAVKAIFDPARWSGRTKPSATIDFELVSNQSLEILSDLRASGQSDGAVLLRELARRLRYLIATREPFEASAKHDLQVTTLWGAKGVTAEHVYVLGLCDAALPGERKPEYPDTDVVYLEEQRRLFYVTITRARRTLVLSRPRKIKRTEGQRLNLAPLPRWGFWPTLDMCRFLRDINPSLPEAVPGEEWGGCVRK